MPSSYSTCPRLSIKWTGRRLATDSGTKCAWVIHESKTVQIHVHNNRRCLYVPQVKNLHNKNSLIRRQLSKHVALTFCMLGKFTAHDVLKYVSYFYPENRLWHFMQMSVWNIEAYFLGKVRKCCHFVVCWTSPENGKGKVKVKMLLALFQRCVNITGLVGKSHIWFARTSTFFILEFLKWTLPCLSWTYPITKTHLYNVDPLQPHFYIVNLRFTRVYIIFLISAQNHRLWVLVRTASTRRF